MYKVYGFQTEGDQLKIVQYLETDRKQTALGLAMQFIGWGLHPEIIEWRKRWIQGRIIPVKIGGGNNGKS